MDGDCPDGTTLLLHLHSRDVNFQMLQFSLVLARLGTWSPNVLLVLILTHKEVRTLLQEGLQVVAPTIVMD